MLVLLALVVAPLLVAGLLARRPIPTSTAPVAGIERLDLDPALVVARKVQSWDHGTLQLTVWREDGRFRAALEPLGTAEHPELLIYWAEPPVEAGWDAAAGRFLGRLAGRYPAAFDLPPGDGRLVLYSLSQNQPLVVVEPPPIAGTPGTDG